MYRYAQINLETGYVVSDSYLSGEVIAENMIPISEDYDLTDKKYINGEWITFEPEQIVPEPTQLDRIEANIQQIMASESALDVLLGVTENE